MPIVVKTISGRLNPSSVVATSVSRPAVLVINSRRMDIAPGKASLDIKQSFGVGMSINDMVKSSAIAGLKRTNVKAGQVPSRMITRPGLPGLMLFKGVGADTTTAAPASTDFSWGNLGSSLFNLGTSIVSGAFTASQQSSVIQAQTDLQNAQAKTAAANAALIQQNAESNAVLSAEQIKEQNTKTLNTILTISAVAGVGILTTIVFVKYVGKRKSTKAAA